MVGLVGYTPNCCLAWQATRPKAREATRARSTQAVFRLALTAEDKTPKQASESSQPKHGSVMLCPYVKALTLSLPGVNFCAPSSK